MMDIASMALAGIVQGVTEWLPISSSGQGMLALINLLGLSPEDAFSLAIFLHLGTLLSVAVKMRAELWDVVSSLPAWRTDRLVQFLIVSTLMTGLVGLPVYFFLKDNFSAWQGDLVTGVIGFFLILTGIFLYFSRKSLGSKSQKDLSFPDMVLAGLAQGLTILPGVSRSGTTVAVLLFRDFDQEDALRLSFIMSVPAIVGALTIDFLDGGFSLFDPVYLVGLFCAFIAGYLSIDVLLRFSRKARFDIFCVVFGSLALLAYVFSLVA